MIWIAPALNAYKLLFLDRLAARGQLELVAVSGMLNEDEGHRADAAQPRFSTVSVNATERQLQYRLRTYRVLIQVIRRNSPDYVLLPAELKHLGLILYLFLLKHVCRFQLVTYTHSHVAWNWPPWLSVPLTKFVFALHDKIIFYTDQAKMTCLRERLVAPEKAFSANNTLDTDSIWQSYTFEINRSPGKRVLFIGRLMANKDLSSLFEYFAELRKHGVGLTIIGDGPERERVRRAVALYPEIEWLGAVTDERIIAEQMRRSHLVFVPGHSGLSIVHSFCYGKPYVTLSGRQHAPEIDYLEDHRSGLLLTGNFQQNIAAILGLLADDDMYEACCRRAFAKAQSLSVGRWCTDIESALS